MKMNVNDDVNVNGKGNYRVEWLPFSPVAHRPSPARYLQHHHHLFPQLQNYSFMIRKIKSFLIYSWNFQSKLELWKYERE